MSAMARSHLARYAAAAAGLCAVLPAAAGAAAAQARSATAPLSVTVTSVTPSYLRQGHSVTIKGLVKNRSGSAASGLSVKLLSSSVALRSRLELVNFAAGRYMPPETPVNVAIPAKPRLGAGQSWRWKIRLRASSLAASCFGVYPLTVQVGDAALQAASDQVPLPYWPSKPASCPGQLRPRPFPISWIWPLIDTPHQDVCPGLTDNALAASIGPRGRLGYLLAVGARYAAQAALTWAIDPALLDSVHAMKQRYRAGAAPHCGDRSWQPASPDAARWLDGVRRATSGHPVFVTPYADVDVAALVRHGNDFHRSLSNGERAAHRILGRPAAPAPLPADAKRLSAVAWPPGGQASSSLLNSFAIRHLSTVVLAAPAASPVRYTPGAVTSALTQIGKRLHILLADRRLTALLGSKLASSRAPGARMHVSQLYLAETAMIAAEAPGKPRPIVIAPPRRWDPTRSLAGDLLGETVHAPWLEPSTAGQLVAMQPEHLYKKLTQLGSVGSHTRRLLNSVSRLDRKIALLQSIRLTPDPGLYRAVAGIESSAWQGKAARQATAMLGRTWRYVDSQLHGVTLRSGGSGHAEHVTFGGKTAPVNVLIHNGLNYPVTVGLLVQASNAKVTGEPPSITVPAHNFSTPVKLTVHVNTSHAKIRVTLIAPPGGKLARHPLPVPPQVILVHPTDFGLIALIIVAIALAIFVIASAFRAIRHGRPEPADGAATRPDDPGSAKETTMTSADAARAPAGDSASDADRAHAADPIFAQTPSPAQDPVPTGAPGLAATPRLVEETIPDWDRTPIQRSGLADLGNRPQHADNVGLDRSELTPAEQAAADHERTAPGGRANQERR
jgi:uncharacterized protein DUF6049